MGRETGFDSSSRTVGIRQRNLFGRNYVDGRRVQGGRVSTITVVVVIVLAVLIIGGGFVWNPLWLILLVLLIIALLAG